MIRYFALDMGYFPTAKGFKQGEISLSGRQDLWLYVSPDHWFSIAESVAALCRMI